MHLPRYMAQKKTYAFLYAITTLNTAYPPIISKQLNNGTVYSLGFMFSVTNPTLLTPQEALPLSEIYQIIILRQSLDSMARNFQVTNLI